MGEEQKSGIRVPKIALVGGGQIGGVIAQLCANRNLGDVVMFDVAPDMPQGKTLDIIEASRVDNFSGKVTGTNDYKDLEGADVIIVTAGVPRKPGMSRDDLLTINAGIVKTVGENIKQYAPNAIVIVVSNPLDAMVTLMQKATGFPASRVLGQAGVLDSSRFATFIAWELEVSVKDVNAPVLGGHGDTMVPLVRYANVNGVPVMEQFERKYKNAFKAKEVMDAIVARTRDAGGEVVRLLKTGSAFYSPASSAVQMAEAILRDEKRVLPVCAKLNGEYGVSGYYVGIMAVLGKNGVERIIEMQLNEEEQAMFTNSVNAVKKLVEDMQGLGL
ncbi:MAG: malate dehydrogenase [Deferribacteraceae bacterium]|jgi:malate dehydrogenase|nr:malate dehydrogenase [Deferribacteraceae bacterium]